MIQIHKRMIVHQTLCSRREHLNNFTLLLQLHYIRILGYVNTPLQVLDKELDASFERTLFSSLDLGVALQDTTLASRDPRAHHIDTV